MNRLLLFTALLLSVPDLGDLYAAEVHVAVASNFRNTASELVRLFEAETGHRVTLIFGSTGKQYAQIVNGAPFDAFLAADALRPRMLEQAGLAQHGSRFTYALGRLALWSPSPGYVDSGGLVLERGNFRRLAIANPKLAPYGTAAREVLESRGLWTGIGDRLVRGENIAQAFQFVKSGNAELGFIARAQLQAPESVGGSHWLVPRELHAPIEQQAVLLRKKPAAEQFLSFLPSEAAVTVIRSHGYDIPDHQRAENP